MAYIILDKAPRLDTRFDKCPFMLDAIDYGCKLQPFNIDSGIEFQICDCIENFNTSKPTLNFDLCPFCKTIDDI